MNCFLKSHGQDVVSNQSDSAPTKVTTSRTWDQQIDATSNIDCDNDSANANANDDVTYAAVASVITTGLSSVNTSTSAPDLSDDEFVTLKLKNKNKNSDFAPGLKLPKGKINENSFENI